MPVSAVKKWAQGVLEQLFVESNLDNDHFIFLAGIKYRKYLTPHICHLEVPLEGLTIGKQLQRLTQLVKEIS